MSNGEGWFVEYVCILNERIVCRYVWVLTRGTAEILFFIELII